MSRHGDRRRSTAGLLEKDLERQKVTVLRFCKATRTTGGSSLASDNGFSAGLSLSPVKAIDFTVGYSRSTHYDLNTFSFGVAVNMRALIASSEFVSFVNEVHIRCGSF